jgi:hypothetical protein
MNTSLTVIATPSSYRQSSGDRTQPLTTLVGPLSAGRAAKLSAEDSYSIAVNFQDATGNHRTVRTKATGSAGQVSSNSLKFEVD